MSEHSRPSVTPPFIFCNASLTTLIVSWTLLAGVSNAIQTIQIEGNATEESLGNSASLGSFLQLKSLTTSDSSGSLLQLKHDLERQLANIERLLHTRKSTALQEPTSPLTTLLLEHRSSLFGAAGIWISVGVASLLFERAKTGTFGTAPAHDRDMFWDVARFVFFLMVPHIHFHLPGECYVEAVVMPGFCILSGLFSRQTTYFMSRAHMLRVVRDCFLNNLLWLLIFTMIGQRTRDTVLWYLFALGVYRFLLQPIHKLGVELIGNVLGSLACICGLALLWNYCPPTLLEETILPSFILAFTLMYAPFYVLGLWMDPQVSRNFLARRSVVCCGVTVISAYLIILGFDPAFQGVYLKSFVPNSQGELYSSAEWITQRQPLLAYFSSLIQRALLAIALLSCLTPFVDAKYAPIRVTIDIFASCGRRTLYGYFLHMFFLRLLIAQHWADLCSVLWRCNPLFALAFEVSLAMALCSPLAVKCFSWLVSPQWVLDFASMFSVVWQRQESAKDSGLPFEHCAAIDDTGARGEKKKLEEEA